MVALTGVEPAGWQPWPVHFSLSGAFSVLAVRRNWQDTPHEWLWCWTRAGRAPGRRAQKAAPQVAWGAAPEARPTAEKPNHPVANWLARIGLRSRTWAPPARGLPPSGRTAPGYHEHCRTRLAG